MMLLLTTGLPGYGRALMPGVLACGVVAAAATFLSEHYGAPVMLFALLLGMAMNFLSAEGPCAAGIEFTARQLLRVGVALLGLRITVEQVAALGWHPVLLVVASVVLTIAVSVAAARLFGFKGIFGVLTGGATAICGVSGALVTTRSSRQFFVLESGRVSMISTLSPVCDSFFSSCTLQMVRRRMYLP